MSVRARGNFRRVAIVRAEETVYRRRRRRQSPSRRRSAVEDSDATSRGFRDPATSDHNSNGEFPTPRRSQPRNSLQLRVATAAAPTSDRRIPFAWRAAAPGARHEYSTGDDGPPASCMAAKLATSLASAPSTSSLAAPPVTSWRRRDDVTCCDLDA